MGLSRTAWTALLGAVVLPGVGDSALAQVRQPGQTLSVGERSGTLSDVSRPLVDDSQSVHYGAQTLGDTSGGSVRSGPVRDPYTRSMLSGSVSDASQGPMTEPRPPLTSGAVADASAGAVKQDIDSPLGQRISSPLSELGPLQQAMRERRQAAEQAVLEGATQPAAPPPEAVQPPDEEALAPEDVAPPPDDAALAPADVAPAPEQVAPDAPALSDAGDEAPAPGDDPREPEPAAAR
jgi:hypothetical protein